MLIQVSSKYYPYPFIPIQTCLNCFVELSTVNIYLEQFCGKLQFLQTTNLNENFSPRGSILMSIKTEISDNIDTAPSEVEVESTQSINEVITLISDNEDD